jgi:phosphate starvation-inducible PhoH-like protein
MRKNNSKSSNRNNTQSNKNNSKPPTSKEFHVELLNTAQKMAWGAFQKHDVIFLLGPAGSGKTFLAAAYAIKQLLSHEKSKIVLTRPIVEAGESLGFLPGDMAEKVNPYMLPLYDCMDKMLKKDVVTRERITAATEVAPLAFMRGRSFGDSICILDEAQNATMGQLKLFLTRFEKDCKIIITGDPNQSDLHGPVALVEAISRLKDIPGISVVEFNANSIVRHPLIAKILERLSDEIPPLPNIVDLYPRE